jgi:MYXO-CTERM domain-containing protein
MSRRDGTKLAARMISLGAAAALLAGAAPAEATGLISLRVPNGSNHCVFCHTDVPEHNAFGLSVLPLIDLPPEELWPALQLLDADEDGQTNAEELGDPCLVWTMGDIPDRVEDISNPGDPLSLSINPLACEEIPSGMGGAGGMGDAGGMGGMPVAEGGAGGAPVEPEPEDPEPEDSANDDAEPTTFNSEPSQKLCSFGVPERSGSSWPLLLIALGGLLSIRRRAR